MERECCHQHPDNGSDLATQTKAQAEETDLRAVNAKLLEALREVTGELGSCLVRESDGHGDHGDLRVNDKALLQRARTAIEEARK